jgi:asparagine synthase (glutamine-hydrolysing)
MFDDRPGPPRDVLVQMVDSLRHRGPDENSTHVDGPLGLGHARLSIIDLEGGLVPLFNEDNSVVVVCNGEIYNYRELREGLCRRGHQFRTHSDCEVLAHLWEEQGSAMLTQLRGMFAFVLYDRKKQLLFGARDFFGQKPLYYYHDEKAFGFASEIKGLLPLPQVPRQLDATALDQYLFYQYVPHPRTLFAGISQLPPGHCFRVENGWLTVERYWEPTFAPDEDRSDEDCFREVEAGLRDAVQSHMVSDVPVGLFLSGGIDSSLMLALATEHNPEPLQTFSIAFRGTEHDESQFARLAARHYKTEHQEFSFQADRIEMCLEQIATIFDQPLGDSAVLPLLYLSEQAAKSVKVVLTGDGGDELFGGYRKYRRAATRLSALTWRARGALGSFSTERLARCGTDLLGIRKLQSRVGMVLVPPLRSAYQRQHWEGWDRHRLYSREFKTLLVDTPTTAWPAAKGEPPAGAVNAMLQMDQLRYLPDDLLLKTDQATMAHGLESRAPLLDHRLAEIAGRLPVHLKVTPEETKVALRHVARKLLPSELADRPKKGFSFSKGDWFRNELRPWVRRCLVEESTACSSLFQHATVERILAEHNSGTRDHASRIYSLLSLELWYRRFFA